MRDFNRFDWIPQVVNDTKLSQNIKYTILNNPKLKPHKAVINKENITISRILKERKLAWLIIKHV